MKHYASVLALLFCAAAAPSGPDDASALAWKTAPGSVVPLNTTLRDELGHDVPLRAIFHGRPVISPTSAIIIVRRYAGSRARICSMRSREAALWAVSITHW